MSGRTVTFQYRKYRCPRSIMAARTELTVEKRTLLQIRKMITALKRKQQ
jgi:hypothetical protein